MQLLAIVAGLMNRAVLLLLLELSFNHSPACLRWLPCTWGKKKRHLRWVLLVAEGSVKS